MNTTPATIATPLALKHHHGAISVPDLDAAIAWYARIFGFTVETRFHVAAIPAEVAMLRRESMRIEVFAAANAAPLPPERRFPDTDILTHGTKHLAFAVPDINAAAEFLRNQKVNIVWIKRFAWGANIFLRDMAGNLLELVEDAET